MKKYETMYDWLFEIENYGTRVERLHDELGPFDTVRMMAWLQAAWNCALMEEEVFDDSELDIERSFQ